MGKRFIEVTSSSDFAREAAFTFIVSYGPTGHPGVVVTTVYNGPADKGAECLKPFTDLGPVMQKVVSRTSSLSCSLAFQFINPLVLVLRQVGPVPFVVVQKTTDPMVPHGRNYYQSGIFLNVCNRVFKIPSLAAVHLNIFYLTSSPLAGHQ